MAGSAAYNDVVEARSKVAEHVLKTPVTLGLFEDLGGTKGDLELIASWGRKAEATNLAQSMAKGSAEGSTADAYEAFAALQRQYKNLMAVLPAVIQDLKRQGNNLQAIAQLEGILRNEAQAVVVTADDGKKKVKRSVSHEAVRAEIWKDMKGLGELTAVHDLLAQRRVTLERIKSLESSAAQLTGKLADKVARRGGSKGVTQQEQDAVRAQREQWAASYRLLRRLGLQDPAVAELLKKAART